MAPRILHFGQQKMLWGCASAHWAEDTGLADIYGAISWHDKRQAEPFLRYATSSLSSIWWRLLRPLTYRAEDIRDRLQAYYDCVEFYSTRKLTRRTDKLPAFSGLASAFRVPKLGAYLAGLWEADHVYGLAWKREGHVIDSKEQTDGDNEYIAPSWSWASMTHGCVVNKFRSVFRGDQPAHKTAQSRWASPYQDWSKQYEPKLISYDYELLTPDPHGKISTAALVLHGFCRTLLVHTANFDMRGISRAAFFDHGSEGHPWKFASPHEYVHREVRSRWSDDTAEFGKVKRLTALQIGMTLLSREGEQPMALVMLILEAVEESANKYRRVGIVEAELPDEEMLPGKWETKDIRMV